MWYLISILEEFRLKLRGSNVVGSYLICTLASRGYPRPVGNIPAGDRERSLDPLTAGIFPARSGISPAGGDIPGPHTTYYLLPVKTSRSAASVA